MEIKGLKFVVAAVLAWFITSVAVAESIQNGFVILSKQEALQWFTNFEVGLAASTGRAERKVFPLSDPRYIPLQRKVDTLWNAFRKEYGKEVQSLPSPQIVLIEASDKNAYAIYDGAKKSYPLLFVVHSSLLEISDDAQYGVFAHELAHLVFKHAIPEIQNAIKIYYKATNRSEPLGFLQKSDENVQLLVTQALASMEKVGPYALDELDGIPLDIWGQSFYTKLLFFARQKYSRLDRPDCNQSGIDFKTMLDALREGLVYSTQEMSLKSEQEVKLRGASIAFGDSFSRCVSDIKPDLAALLAAQYGADVSVIRASMEKDPDREAELFNEQPNLVESLRAVTKKHFAKIQELERTNDLSLLRVYTHEEQADDVSVKIMLALKQNPYNNAKFLIGILSEAERKACMTKIRQQSVPNYGLLSDPHHSTCYRIYHSREFIRFLSKNETQCPIELAN